MRAGGSSPDRYDDGGLSGASLDRPALQSLLTAIRLKKIDVVVVYKVDRLTRSLGDFAKLVDLFDQHSVSFVSVTQSFNTTTSMGRLTLNVLLSFAQFEREVIGERVRDKIAASKKKGLWVGGWVPLGYASVNKKPVTVPEEAETVRTIFRRYLELGSVGALVQGLDAEGIRTRRRVLAGGKTGGGCRFGVGAIAYILRNRFYNGEVVYRGEAHRGEQEPIVDRDLFEAVQARLAANAVTRRVRLRASPAILAGRIFDDRGNRMSPSHSNKRGVRYRYYVSHAVLQRQDRDTGSVARVPAAEIEAAVIAAVRDHLALDSGRDGQPDDRDLVGRHVERVVVKREALEIRLVDAAPALVSGGYEHQHATEPIPDVLVITVPWTGPAFAAVKGILHAPSHRPTLPAETRDALLAAIAKARAWIDDLVAGRAADIADIARREGKVERHIRQLAPLAFVSPRIVAAIADRTAPADLTVTALAQVLPLSWAEQERKIGLLQ